jgi:hypothetical protein
MTNRIRSTLCLLCLLAGASAPACTQVAGLDHTYSPAIDAPCQSSADCVTGVCNGTPGWCTEPCSSDAECPSGWCVESSSGTNGCFPECVTDDDCASYGVATLLCRPATTVGGTSASVCATSP